jgi:hypothetical protein
VAHQVRGRLAHHRPEELQALFLERLLLERHADEQDHEGDFIELDAVPARPAVQEHVLRPLAVGVLHDGQVKQHAPGAFVRAHR